MHTPEIHDITKEYTEMYKVVIFKRPYIPYTKDSNTENKKTIKPTPSFDDSIQRSVRRTRTVINDYVKCNDFDLFVTFTFDPKKVDRYDMTLVYQKMQGWLFRARHNYPNFRYLIVPEKHKDGAIHFHALFGGYEGKLKQTRVVQNSKRVYNINGFRFGFTNAQYLDSDRQKTTAYLCKYITKDMDMIHGRRRYWCSKNLRKPVTLRNALYDLGLNRFANHKTLVYETEYNVIYEVPKDLLA